MSGARADAAQNSLKAKGENMLKKIIRSIFFSRPDLLILGAEKAGTTSLYRYLIKHPKIIKAKFKETHYFSENHRLGFSWYLSFFPNRISKVSKLTLEATPTYLATKHVPGLIKKELGDIKMIAILRDPVARAYSAWKMYHRFHLDSNAAGNVPSELNESLKKMVDTRSFFEAVDQELSCQNTYPYNYQYVDKGKYAEHLENYYSYFKKESLLVLSLDDFQTHFVAMLRQVCDFLKIEPFPKERLRNLVERKYNVGEKAEVSSCEKATLGRLKKYFEPFNQKLYKLLGRNFNW